MDEQIYTGPPLPQRVRAAFAVLAFVQSRIQPCCHPPGELTKQESATEATALRTIVHYMTGEQDFNDPAAPAGPTAPTEKPSDSDGPSGSTVLPEGPRD